VADDDVTRASKSGDPGELADALVRRATERLQTGRFAEAARDLSDAAGLLDAAGRTHDAIRTMIAQATALRANGELALAIECAQQARARAPGSTPLRVSAETELAEGELLAGRPDAAIESYTQAIEHGQTAGLLPVAQAALHRRIALAHAMAGRHEHAAEASKEAARLYEMFGHAGETAAAKIQAATALVAAGLAGAAARAIDDARAAAGENHAALADIALLESARAMADGRNDDALVHAREARNHARQGDSIVAYVGAAIAIAEMLDHKGDRAGAYDSLAVGWVTAGKQIGDAAAAALFAPKLAEMRTRWGDEAFAAVKQAYYAERDRS
jgi:tetratricopeptide (TPR) repeat protein